MNVWQKQAERNAAYERGVFVDLPGFDGWRFAIRPLGKWNVYFRRAAMRAASSSLEIIDYLARAKADNYKSTPEDDALESQMQNLALADGCVCDWKGVTDENGEPLPYSLENARKVLAHFPQIAEFVDIFASDARNFPALTEDQKADIALGNSAPASPSLSGRGGNTSRSSRKVQTGDAERPVT